VTSSRGGGAAGAGSRVARCGAVGTVSRAAGCGAVGAGARAAGRGGVGEGCVLGGGALGSGSLEGDAMEGGGLRIGGLAGVSLRRLPSPMSASKWSRHSFSAACALSRHSRRAVVSLLGSSQTASAVRVMAKHSSSALRAGDVGWARASAIARPARRIATGRFTDVPSGLRPADPASSPPPSGAAGRERRPWDWHPSTSGRSPSRATGQAWRTARSRRR